MKVLLVNGSPNEKGCTYTALAEVGDALQKAGIDAEMFWIGKTPLAGCIACGHCQREGRCVYDDAVNVFLAKAGEADGFVFGSPVHYASAGGAITSFMDRAFYADRGDDRSVFAHKPAAAIASARRAGTTATLDQLNKYFTISQMLVVASQYWNMVHGNTPEEVRQDLEGMQIMRTLGRNMAWLLRCLEAGRQAGIALPEREPHVGTNFIR